MHQPSEIIYPHQVLTWEDMPGEEWKEIPFGEGHFEISNIGRVRAHERMIQTADGRVVTYKARIVRQQAIVYPNETVGDQVMHLRVHLRYQGRSSQFYIHRMVFLVFGSSICLNETSLVLHKNGDHFDNRISNLYCTGNSEKTKLIYQKKRAPLLSTFLTPESRKMGAAQRFKAVSQYSINGSKINSFESIKQAAATTRISASGIAAACKLKHMASAGGYLWQYGNGPDTIDTAYYYAFLNRKQPAVQSWQQENVSLLE